MSSSPRDQRSQSPSVKPATAPTSASLLHLLADASSGSSSLPSKIGASYHLSPNLPLGPPSPAPGLVTDGAGGKKRKADQDGSDFGGKKDKGKQPAAGKQVLSCQECRRLKLKCDRVFPCSCCRKRGVGTICPDGELKGGKGKRLILADTVELHARISTLEQALHDAHCQATGSTAPHPLLASSFHFEPLDSVDSVPPPPPIAGPSSMPSRPRDPIDATPADIAQRSNYGSLTMSEEPGVTRFFGPAGSQYFLAEDSSPSPSSAQQISRPSSHDPYGNSYSSTSTSNGDDFRFGLSQTPSGLTDSFPFEGAPASNQMSLEVLRSYLPSRELAWNLAETYYRNASWMCEDIIPRASFYTHFFPHFYPTEPTSQPVNNHRLAVVYMVLSLGSIFDLNVPAQNKTSRKYYALARASLAWDTTASVAMVQAIHLMVTFLMHSEKATTGGEASWPLLRLAVAAAQSIGLHRDGANWNLRPEEVEERRRVFWEINSYDISQSIALGRPRAMAASTIDTQFPGPGTDLRTAGQQKYLFCNVHTQINDLQTSAVIGTFHQVIKIDREIRAFEKALPTVLHCTEDSCVLPEDGEDWDAKKLILQRYSNLLMINAALLFTHRGCFARALRDHPDEPLKSKFSQSYVAELEASKVLISILRDVLKLQMPLVSRFWIFFFHSFSAAASLAVAVIRAPKSSLAKAAFEEVELAVSLFEMAKVGSRPRDELPTLQRLRDRARNQLLSCRGLSRKLDPTQPTGDDLDLLGSETTLHRRAPTNFSSTAVSTPASSSSASQPSSAELPSQNTMSPDPFRLPTTFEEAAQLPNFESAADMTSFDGFPSWMQDPMPYGEVGSLESAGMFGFGQPSGIGGGQDNQFDFDEFIAGLGGGVAMGGMESGAGGDLS